MRCLKCQNQWDIIGEKTPEIEKCPKCNERVIANNNNFENISEGIYYCIIKGSKKPFDILKNKEKFNHYIDDSLGNSFSDRKLLKNAIECGVGSILFEAAFSNDNAKIEARKKAVTTFSREYSVINEKAETVIGYFCDALGWNKSSNDNSIHKSVSKKLNSENDFTPVLTKSGIKSNTSSLVIENDSSKPEDAKKSSVEGEIHKSENNNTQERKSVKHSVNFSKTNAYAEKSFDNSVPTSQVSESQLPVKTATAEVVSPIISIPQISTSRKVLCVLACLVLIIISSASCVVAYLLSNLLPVILSGFVFAIIGVIAISRVKYEKEYRNIVDFPDYITVKHKEKKEVWYFIVPKVKTYLIIFITLSVMIALGSAVVLGREKGITWSFGAFSFLSIFSTFYITDKRTLWKKTALGIVIGVVSILIILLSFILFAGMLIKMI